MTIFKSTKHKTTYKMTKTILSTAIVLATMSAQAQDYKPVLEKTFTAFDTTWNQDAKMEQANKLTLIAKKWPDEWVTHYYAAYAKVQVTYMEKDAAKKD